MSARIRGHYRIDAAGRVEAVGDINSSLQSYAYIPPAKRMNPAERRSRLVRSAVGVVAIACIGLALMASLPQIQRAVVAADAAHYAALRKAARLHSNFSASEHPWRRPIADE